MTRPLLVQAVLSVLATGPARPSEIYEAIPLALGELPRPCLRTLGTVLRELVRSGQLRNVDRGYYVAEALPSLPSPLGNRSARPVSPIFPTRATKRSNGTTPVLQDKEESEAKALASLSSERPCARARAMPWLTARDTPPSAELLAHVRELLEPELRAGETIERKLGDVSGFDPERVAVAVAHCWLLRARRRRVQSLAASFWWALAKAAPGRLEEGAVANLEEVARTVERARARPSGKRAGSTLALVGYGPHGDADWIPEERARALGLRILETKGPAPGRPSGVTA